MKDLTKIIQEKLTVNSKSKVIEKRGILDENIYNLKDLIPICQQYFEENTIYKIEVSKISTSPQKWKMLNSSDGIIVKDHFEIKFYHNVNKCSRRLRFGIFGNHIVMQFLVLGYTGKWRLCRIHGMAKINEFNIGDNFLDFILKIKKHTEEKHPIGKDNNLMPLFTNLESN